ncbi:phosphatase PAP2 family protein [Verticiella sediminum]|uniref:Acid phosphatase n=2 Tax=Verticiella sediminum TaxID=1247510 RepID=A0A556ACY9_9BURK|nr:phosphatase PAP2 family protein [Verticiella sediminum]
MLCALASVGVLAGCAQGVVAPTDPAAVGEVRKGILNGYLTRADHVDSLALLPPPPAEGTPAFAADVAAYQALGQERPTPRGAQAVSDAQLRFPQAANSFTCALGVPIDAQRTPNILMLMRRTLADAGGATYNAKEHYQRTRPFVHFKAPSCTPDDEPHLAKDGSYPSGHSALGWAWGLVLTEVAPERRDALAQRGYQFGQSRAICGVHWQSDVDAGRVVGAAAVARLNADPVFLAQLDAARKEYQRLRDTGVSATGCSSTP